MLRVGITLIRRLAIPLHGFGTVLWHADAKVVVQAEGELRVGITLIGRPAIPLHGFSDVLRHAVAVDVPQAEVGLRGGVTCFRFFPRLVERLRESNRHQKSGHAEQASEVSNRRTVRAAAIESKGIGTVGCVVVRNLLGQVRDAGEKTS